MATASKGSESSLSTSLSMWFPRAALALLLRERKRFQDFSRAFGAG